MSTPVTTPPVETGDTGHSHLCAKDHHWQHAGPSAEGCALATFNPDASRVVRVSEADCAVCAGRDDLLTRPPHSHDCPLCEAEWIHEGRCVEGLAHWCPWDFAGPNGDIAPGRRSGRHLHSCPECSTHWVHLEPCAARWRVALSSCPGCGRVAGRRRLVAWSLGAIGGVAAIILVTIQILPINSAGRRAPARPQAVAPLLRSAEQAVSPSLQAGSGPPVEPRSSAPTEGEPRVEESAGSEGPGDREARPRDRSKGASASAKPDSQLPQGSRLGVPFARGAPLTGGGTTLDARRALEDRPRTMLDPASRPPGTARQASQTLDVTRRAVVRVMAFQERVGRAGDGGRTVRSSFGFVVNENGIVLTLGRVVAGATKVAVVLPDGRTIPVTTIAIDRLNDLAVLQVEAGRLWAVPLGTSGTLRVGDPVFALGSPAVGETVGTVRATGTATGGDLVTARPTGQLRAGLPLLNERGEAVGIVVRTSAAGSGSALDVAVPIDRAKRLLRDLGPAAHGAPRDFAWETTSDR